MKEPDVLVCPPAPFDKKQIWRDGYVAYMVSQGIDEADARALCNAGKDEHNYDSNPIDAAMDEMSVWASD